MKIIIFLLSSLLSLSAFAQVSKAYELYFDGKKKQAMTLIDKNIRDLDYRKAKVSICRWEGFPNCTYLHSKYIIENYGTEENVYEYTPLTKKHLIGTEIFFTNNSLYKTRTNTLYYYSFYNPKRYFFVQAENYNRDYETSSTEDSFLTVGHFASLPGFGLNLNFGFNLGSVGFYPVRNMEVEFDKYVGSYQFLLSLKRNEYENSSVHILSPAIRYFFFEKDYIDLRLYYPLETGKISSSMNLVNYFSYKWKNRLSLSMGRDDMFFDLKTSTISDTLEYRITPTFTIGGKLSYGVVTTNKNYYETGIGILGKWSF